MIKMFRIFVGLFVVCSATQVKAVEPACDGVGSWPAMMTFAKLKNEGITDNAKVDFNKTRVEKLASEKIGQDLYRQVHLVKYIEKSGNVIEAITISDASSQECSMSSVQIFIIEKKLSAG